MFWHRRPVYEDYINSPAWVARKRRYYQRHRRRCRACRSVERIHLHHKTYKHLGHEWNRDLVALCEECHNLVHTVHRGSGRNLAAVTNGYIKGRRKWWWVGD